jgi:hypothetical protein
MTFILLPLGALTLTRRHHAKDLLTSADTPALVSLTLVDLTNLNAVLVGLRRTAEYGWFGEMSAGRFSTKAGTNALKGA